MNKKKIVVIPGDGIGQEVMSTALSITPYLKDISNVEYLKLDSNYTDRFFSEMDLKYIECADYILLGAIQTPHEPDANYNSLVGFLRQSNNLATNIRPFNGYNKVEEEEFDIVIFRQNTEGLYFQKQYFKDDCTACAEKIVTKNATENLVEDAFNFAMLKKRKKITIITKSNILFIVDRFFKDVSEQKLNYLMRETNYHVEVDHVLVDAAAYKLIKESSKFDIIITMNLYGDILSDLLAGLVGSIGICPSINKGKNKILFEPIHGAAPDISGKNKANPIGMILSICYLLDELGQEDKANLIRSAIKKTIKDEQSTADLGGKLNTNQYIDVLKKYINTN